MYLEIIFVVTKWILNRFSHFKPAKEEDELEYEEDWYEGVWILGQLLTGYKLEPKVDIHCKSDNLRTSKEGLFQVSAPVCREEAG